MSKVVSITTQQSAADYLEGLAADLRKRDKPEPVSVVVFGLHRDRNGQLVEFWCGPCTLSPLEFLGLVEMGKATYIESSGE